MVATKSLKCHVVISFQQCHDLKTRSDDSDDTDGGNIQGAPPGGILKAAKAANISLLG